MFREGAKLLLGAALIVTGLTTWLKAVPSGPALFPLAAGLMVGLQITGGHGGSHAEELIAGVVGFAVNILVYAVLLGVLRLLYVSAAND